MAARPHRNRSAAAAFLTLAVILPLSSTGAAEPLVNEAIINAPVSEVWRLFTTAEGMQSWMVARADIDLRVGGLMRTRYADDGPLGDDKTIVNRVLSFEPERMLSIQVDRPPADFPWPNEVGGMWTVIYFQPLEPGMTNVRVVGMGFHDDDASRAMRTHFAKGNAWTLEQLQKKFWAGCARCEK